MPKRDKVIERVVLAPEQKSAIYTYLRHKPKDKFLRYFDGAFYDACKELLSLIHREDLLNQLKLSIKDKSFTKMFYNYKETIANFDHYVDGNWERNNNSWNVNFQVAKDLLVKQLNVRKLNRVRLYEGMDTNLIWTRKEASCGFIGTGTKEDNEIACIRKALELERLIREGESFNDIFIPNKMFHRSQFSGYVDDVNDKFTPDNVEMKDRMVWCADGGTESLEASYSQPLINHLSRYWNQYAGGKSPGELRMLVRRGAGMAGVSIDYSKFDQTVQWWVIREAFNILKMFYGSKEACVLDWICHNFIHTWIAIPGKGLVQKHRGIPSGSGFTQIVGSMCNALMLYTYLAHLTNGTPEQKESEICHMLSRYGSRPTADTTCLFMGDDCAIFSQRHIDLNDLSSYVLSMFGMTVNPKKCEVWGAGEHAKFLKREWFEQGEYRNLLEILINTSHPERERNYGDADDELHYSPWHILYGLFCTYTEAFRGVDESWLIQKMQVNGGLERLLSVKPYDLPGSLRVLSFTEREYLYRRARRQYQLT